MNTIIAIRYIDALYYTEQDLKHTNFKTNIAIGNLIISSGEHIAISFTEKNGVAEEGLLIPKQALILKGKNREIQSDLSDVSSRIGSDIGIYWTDIVHFTNGSMSDKCTVMYSEGNLYKVTPDAVIIKDPETIKTGIKIDNHPVEKPTFIAIPKSFITNLEFYDKKL